MKKVIILIIAATLGACGANGDPVRPSANLGVNIGSGGISPSASVGAQSGPVSLSVGL